MSAISTSAGAATSKMALQLPSTGQALSSTCVPSPTALMGDITPNMWAKDRSCSVSSNIMCPSAPTKQDPRLPSSLDPSPTAPQGDVTPASFLPNDVFTKGKLRFSLDATSTEEPAPSGEDTPVNLCARDRSCSVSLNIISPSAPVKQDPRLPSSLDPSPTAATGDISFFPNDVPTQGDLRYSIEDVSTEEVSPSSDDTPVNLCQRDRTCSVRSNIVCPSAPTKRDPRLPSSLDPTPTGARTPAGKITPVAFFANQSSAPFSADETPIAAAEADATPMSFHIPSRGVSNSSLNNAHILDSTPSSFVSSADDSRKYSATSPLGVLEPFSNMQDSGPPMSMRWLGC